MSAPCSPASSLPLPSGLDPDEETVMRMVPITSRTWTMLALGMVVFASTALAQAPGSPLVAGGQFSLKVRENFTIPAQPEPGQPAVYQTPVPVAPGFLVLKDDPNKPNND